MSPQGIVLVLFSVLLLVLLIFRYRGDFNAYLLILLTAVITILATGTPEGSQFAQSSGPFAENVFRGIGSFFNGIANFFLSSGS